MLDRQTFLIFISLINDIKSACEMSKGVKTKKLK